jgi:hypothetical protein
VRRVLGEGVDYGEEGTEASYGEGESQREENLARGLGNLAILVKREDT